MDDIVTDTHIIRPDADPTKPPAVLLRGPRHEPAIRKAHTLSSDVQLTSGKVAELKVLEDRGVLPTALILGLAEMPSEDGQPSRWKLTTLGFDDGGWDRTALRTMAQVMVPFIGLGKVDTLLTWHNGVQERLTIDAGKVSFHAL